VVIVDPSILDKFKGENLYNGIKIVLPEGDYVFNSADALNIAEIYSSFVFKVNQID